ncbi:MAG: VOC family protein [Chitinophagaceae bacterium]|nr:MAG: VOC family protein [Chitinophagaceae bacterium]
MKIPQQYTGLMPYLIVKNSVEFMTFMQTVFNAEEQMKVLDEHGSIMHGELKIQDSVLMFAEAGEQFPVMNAGMFIYVDNADETYQKAIRAGATTVPGQEPSNKEYGRACGVTDPFGNTWWITSVL